MKRHCCAWALLLVLLTGCAGQAAQSTDAADATEPTEYAPKKLASCPLPEDTYTSVSAMGTELLLVGSSQLLRVSGQTMEVTGTVALGEAIPSGCELLRADETGAVLYDAAGRTLYCLNADLQVTGQIHIPEEALGTVQLTQDGSAVYYCAADGIRALELTTGVSRVLTARAGDWLGIDGLMFDDSLLCCRLAMADGTVRTCFISTRDGKTVCEVEDMGTVYASGDLYYCAIERDGTVERIFGWRQDQPQLFTPKTEAELFPVPEGQSVVSVQTIKAGSILYCYDLTSGKRIASIKLSGVSEVSNMTWLDGRMCFLGDGALYLWDISQTPTADNQVYTAYRYTEDDPDTPGILEQVQEARLLEQTYGVDIILWNSAQTVAPQDFSFTVEYIPERYAEALATLETAMARFPRGFFQKTSQWTDSGLLHIVLVRQIQTPSEEDYATIGGMQYLLDGESYIVLALGDGLETEFYHALGHAVDTVVLSGSTALYSWSDLNPKRFTYDYDYITNLSRDGSKYLSGKDRYFVDTYSMSYPVEDRATIFAYAVTPEHASVFSSEHMQEKLQTLCDGIREAFGLTGDEYIWEQYLPTDE